MSQYSQPPNNVTVPCPDVNIGKVVEHTSVYLEPISLTVTGDVFILVQQGVNENVASEPNMNDDVFSNA